MLKGLNSLPVQLINAVLIVENIHITPDECDDLMNELRSIGSTNFMMKYLRDDARFKLEEILYAFGYLVVRVRHSISYTSLISLKFLPRRCFWLWNWLIIGGLHYYV